MRFKLSLAWLSAWACWALPNPMAENMFRGLPVTFERNQGQWPRDVEFGAHIAGHRYTFSNKEIVIDGSVHLDLVSPAHGKLEPLDPVATKTNYLSAKDPSKSIVQIPNYSRLEVRNAFPGIDLLLYGSHGQLEFDYVVTPGAEPDRIHFRVRGAKAESASEDLKLVTPSGQLLHVHALVAYQDTRSGRKRVKCHFRVDSSGEISFATASIERTAALLIDPVLTYLGVLGETARSPLTYSTTDANGAFYLAGSLMDSTIATTPGVLRNSGQCDVPHSPGADCNDSWVIKLNPSDHQVAWATYFPSINSILVRSIALDPTGNIVVGGVTWDSSFPVSPDAYLPTIPSGIDGFETHGAGTLTRLNSTGSAVLYSTFLEAVPLVMKVDTLGAVYFSNGPQIQKLNADGSAILYSIQTPGGVTQIAVDKDGNLYAVSGPSEQLAVTPSAYKTSDSDGLYILKFDSQGKLLFASSYNAPTSYAGQIQGPDIALDSGGNIVFTGQAGSGVPVLNDPQPQTNDCDPKNPCMAFVAALDPTGSRLLYSRLLGHGIGQKLALGHNGEVYVAGLATDVRFPRTWDAFQYCSNPASSFGTISLTDSVMTFNGFIMRLGSQGQREFSSFLGTSQSNILHLRLAADGTLYVGLFSFLNAVTLNGYFSAIDTNQTPRIPHVCLVNATQNVPDANGQYLWVAPGQMVTLFGEGLGPQTPAPAEWNADGSLSNTLAGVQVLFDGIPAPMLYAQYNQVNCIVPFGVAGKDSTSIVVQYAGSKTDPLVFHSTS